MTHNEASRILKYMNKNNLNRVLVDVKDDWGKYGQLVITRLDCELMINSGMNNLIDEVIK